MEEVKATEFLLEGVKALDQTFTVTGRLANKRVAVNLLVDSKVTDIAYHFNPRLDERCVVLNNCRDTKWQKEQRGNPQGNFPWQENAEATFKIKVDSHGISSWCNGIDLGDCYFHHRVDVTSLHGIQVVGMQVESVKIEPGDQQNDKVTVLCVKKQEFRGKKVTLDVIPVEQRPAVNFLIKDSFQDYALHFNPRFDVRTVVSNSKVNGAWQTSDPDVEMPSEVQGVGGKMQLEFLVAEQNICCSMNRKEVRHFRHRLPVSEMVGLVVYGFNVSRIDIQ